MSGRPQGTKTIVMVGPVVLWSDLEARSETGHARTLGLTCPLSNASEPHWHTCAEMFMILWLT